MAAPLVNSYSARDSGFPNWVIRKIGVPYLTEADWNYTLPNAKFGLFASSTGTIARDTTNLFFGGAGSCQMTTTAVSNDASEVKQAHDYVNPAGWLLSFEHKWAFAPVSGGTAYDMGIEPRSNTLITHGRWRWTNTTGEWKYQLADLSYASFPASVGGPLTPEKPTISATSGTKFGWARCIVDPTNLLYVGFEASGKAGKIETRDMRPMGYALPSQGASTAWELLYFVLIQNGAASIETGFTTDWCFSMIPPWVDPFTGN